MWGRKVGVRVLGGVRVYARTMRIGEWILDVVVMCMTVALCVSCTGTRLTEGAILND